MTFMHVPRHRAILQQVYNHTSPLIHISGCRPAWSTRTKMEAEGEEEDRERKK